MKCYKEMYSLKNTTKHYYIHIFQNKITIQSKPICKYTKVGHKLTTDRSRALTALKKVLWSNPVYIL